jgi:hypothetical protein
MYRSVREQLVAIHDAQGRSLRPQQLENCTAVLMADARQARMHSVTSMTFAVHDNGQIDTGKVYMFEGDPKNPASNFSRTDMAQATQSHAAQSYQQFDQHTQAMERQEQQWAQERLAEQHSQGMSR